MWQASASLLIILAVVFTLGMLSGPRREKSHRESDSNVSESGLNRKQILGSYDIEERTPAGNVMTHVSLSSSRSQKNPAGTGVGA